MTNMKLHELLGEAIEEVHALKNNSEEAVFILKKAEVVSSLAKRTISNNNQILLADKLCGRTDRINKVVG